MRTKSSKKWIPVLGVLAVLLAGGVVLVLTNLPAAETPAPSVRDDEPRPEPTTSGEALITVATPLAEVMALPEFAGFGDVVFPTRQRISDDMTVADAERLLPYHSNIDPEEVASTLNQMVAEARDGRLAFHPVYNEAEIAADPAKAEVGLFHFAGEPGAPFAIVSPGGGFSYVGSIHEGFPYAQQIASGGQHAFVINYRTGGGGRPAMEDLAAAIDFVFEQQDTLGVSVDGYSLWGSSAGARMAANLGSYGPQAYGYPARPQPSAVVMAYTGHADYTGSDPATFVVVGSNDGIASPVVMEDRIRRLDQAGVPTEFHLYEGVGHGFGPGTGTVAEGWVADAIVFWETQAPVS